MRNAILPLAIGLAVALSSQAHAERDNATRVLDKAGPGTLDSPVSTSSGVELTAGQGSSDASIKASFLLPPSANAIRSLSLTASAPLSKGDEPTDLATLDRLANSSSLELKYTSTSMTGQLKPTDADRKQVCDKVADFYPMAGLKEVDFTGGDCDGAHIDNLIGIIKERRGRGFLDQDIAPSIKALRDLKRQQRNLEFDENSTVLMGGFNVRAGYESFDYFEPTTLAPRSSDETSWSAGAFFAFQPGRMPALFTFSYEHQDGYEAAKKVVACPAGPGPVICVNGSVGAPKATRSELLSFEARVKPTARFGFAVTATYDVEAETFGVDVPLYLVSDDKGGLSGGIRLGWTDESDNVTAAVFVSKAFNLYD